jgi:hypothetical protein
MINSLQLVFFQHLDRTKPVFIHGLDRYFSDLKFSTVFPSGMFASATFKLKRKAAEKIYLSQTNMVNIFYGRTIVWEGEIVNLSTALSNDVEDVRIEAVGYWSIIMRKNGINKPWADVRIGEEVWIKPVSAYDANDRSLLEVVDIDRTNRIRFTPKNVAFAIGYYGRVVYTAPTGQTIKRITFNYDFQEAAQSWRLAVFNEDTATRIVSIETSGTGSIDHTLATPAAKIWLYFQNVVASTPPDDGTIYGQASSIVVYTETGSITPTEVAKDIIPLATGLSTSTNFVGSNTTSLVPFITDGEMSFADILQLALQYGDSSLNQWAAYILPSLYVPDKNGKVPLVVEAFPDLTSPTYEIIWGRDMVTESIQIEDTLETVINSVSIVYSDKMGREVIITPDDDATLKDATSISKYGTRKLIEPLRIGSSSTTLAKQFAKRYLATYKDPKPTITAPLRIGGSLRYYHKQNSRPLPLVWAGKVLALSNFPGQRYSRNVLITQTNYDAEEDTLELITGVPNNLAMILARMEQFGILGTREV